eukprot:10677130-Alexandrium_andersonii.AAC.1
MIIRPSGAAVFVGGRRSSPRAVLLILAPVEPVLLVEALGVSDSGTARAAPAGATDKAEGCHGREPERADPRRQPTAGTDVKEVVVAELVL